MVEIQTGSVEQKQSQVGDLKQQPQKVQKKSTNKGSLRHSIGGVSKRFISICEIYYRFGYGFTQDHTFTEKDIVELYNQESYGTGVSPLNGYALGKKIMDITIAMWREDIGRGHLSKYELYKCGEYPEWWLDSVLKNIVVDASGNLF